jgi:serine protease Do
VVGINTAIFSRSGGYMGVGFAIPSNRAKAIANQLIKHGEVTRVYLGIVIQPLTPDLAESFDIDSGMGILGGPGQRGIAGREGRTAPGRCDR